MPSHPILEAHEKLCDETHQLLLEANSYLRQTQSELPKVLLEQKQALIPRLQASVDALKMLSKEESQQWQETIAQAQKKTLKILHLLQRK